MEIDEEKISEEKLEKLEKIKKHITDWLKIQRGIKIMDGPYENEDMDEQDEKYKITLNDGTEIILYVHLQLGVTSFIVHKKGLNIVDKKNLKRKFDDIDTFDGRKSKRSLNRKSVKRSLNRKSVYTKNDLDKLIGVRCLKKMTLKNGKSYIGTFGSKEYFNKKGVFASSESGIYGIHTTTRKRKLILAKLEDIINVSDCNSFDLKKKIK